MEEKYISEDYKNKIKGIYQDEKYIESSGLPFDELKGHVDAYFNKNKNSLSVTKIRAEVFSYILSNAQLDVRDDYFADRINHYPGPSGSGSLLNDIRRVYEKENDERMKEWNDFVDACESNFIRAGSDLGHIVPCWDNLFAVGLPGILNKAKNSKITNPGHEEFYDSVISDYDALIKLAKRMSIEANKLNTEKSKKLSTVLENISNREPQTLHEVLELNLLFFSIQCYVECDYIRSISHADEFYKPYYEHDLNSGCSQKELDELLAAFFLRLSEIPLYANSPICIGGHNSKKISNYTYFTEKLIDIYSTLDVYSPKIQVIYSKEMPKELGVKICELIKRGKSSFVFINEEVVQQGFINLGYNPQDVERIYIIGCYEPIAYGTELCSSCNGNVSLPKCLQLALDNGYDYLYGKQIGVKSGGLETFGSFNDLISAVKKQIKLACEKSIRYTSYFEKNYMRATTAPLLSATYDISLEKGIDVRDGGMKYNTSGINVVGLATIVDSLSCIKHFVYDIKKISLKDLNEILHANWEGHEDLRIEFINYKNKYGNNIKEVDDIMIEIYDYAAEQINGKKNGRKGFFKCGTFSVDIYMYFISCLGGSANGRKSTEFMSKNLCPSVGCDYKGITATINSLTKLNSSKTVNGTVYDFIIHPSIVDGENGAENLFYIITTYLNNGGFAIHGNVFDYKFLEAAQKDPVTYKNLQVRVCGWNAYFVNLSKAEQNIFIKEAKFKYVNSDN